MLCKQCKKEIPNDSQYCPNCGLVVAEKTVETSGDVFETGQGFNEVSQTQFKEGQAENESKTLLFGVIGVVLSFLFYVGVPFVHLIGIFLGRQGIIYAKQDKQYAGRYSRNGLLLSWLAVILAVFGIIFNIVYMIMNPDQVNV